MKIHYGDGCRHEPGDPEALEGTLCWHCGALLYFEHGQWRERREAPGESGHMYSIRLNVAQQNALLSVLIDHSLRKDSTREWIDIVNESAVTIEDLLSLVAVAPLAASTGEWEPMPAKLQSGFRGESSVDALPRSEARPADNRKPASAAAGLALANPSKSAADKKGTSALT